MASSASPASQPLVRLFLDARASFPYTTPPPRQTTSDWAATEAVASSLELLPEAEQARILKYHFPKDAALSLSSYLLKHLAVARSCSAPWHNTPISQSRDVQNGKPYYAPGGVEFNVSHHGEVAVVIAATAPDVRVGIDLVQIDMDRDARSVREQGWSRWLSTYREIFSSSEVQSMERSIGLRGTSLDEETVKRGLRSFYAHWGLKEAYFKMTGDALLSDHLQELEFTDVELPQAAAPELIAANKWAWGGSTRVRVALHGKSLPRVQLELLALGEHYMVATAVDGDVDIPAFTQVKVQRDIMPLAGI